MKGNAEFIHFLMKSRGVQGIVAVQTTFGKCTTNFHFQNTKAGIKTSNL